MKAKTITRTAMMSAVICLCSWLAFPSAVPFTMQSFAVMTAFLVLGGKQGTLSVFVYILLGAIGLPVFSGFTGGLGHLAGPTGGYIAGFLFSGLAYIALESPITKHPKLKLPALFLCQLICYLCGTFWFVKVTETAPLAAFSLCVLPYLIPDFAKIFLATALSNKLSNKLSNNFQSKV